MSAYNTLSELFTAIADAIRSKLDYGNTKINAVYFPSMISQIPVGHISFDGLDWFYDNRDIPPTELYSYTDTWTGGIAENAFQNYTSLEFVHAPKVGFVGPHAFDGCTSLALIEFTNLQFLGEYAFRNCSNLRSLTVGFRYDEATQKLEDGAFNNCTNLTMIDLGGFSGYLGDTLFTGCNSLEAIIFRNNVASDLVTIFDWNNPFANLPNTCYIYVPSKHFEAFCNQFSSSIGNKVRILEDYTVDGTTDGELDETKI